MTRFPEGSCKAGMYWADHHNGRQAELDSGFVCGHDAL